MTDIELAVVPPAVRDRALRAALIAWDRELEGYGLDPLARLDLLELELEAYYERCAGDAQEMLN